MWTSGMLGAIVRPSIFLAFVLLAGCEKPADGQAFPSARREVAPIVADRFSTEDARDRIGEADTVMRIAGVKAGMSVADIGAGEGYYTVRLAPLVGPKGRVLAEDIVPETVTKLADRVHREQLDNVSVKLGKVDDPMLPPNSFDRVFLVHMYHEVEQPYAFLWHLRAGLRKDGQVVVVDADRPIRRHGIPPPLLRCEFAALGLTPTSFTMIDDETFVAMFKTAGDRPSPAQVQPCNLPETGYNTAGGRGQPD